MPVNSTLLDRAKRLSTLVGAAALLVLLSITQEAFSQGGRRSWEEQRLQMVERELVDAGIENDRVLDAMRSTKRHEFVPLSKRRYAYFDMALPIGSQQTISPPFVVAYMTEQLNPQPTDRVLEIGTGSGYQAAVLSSLVDEVYSIEIVPELGRKAERTLRKLKYENVHTRVGDGYRGWPEAAPFDKIIVTCSPESPPQALVDQLAEGGQMVIPTGERFQQNLYRLTKRNGELERETLRATLFVPMTGQAEERRQRLPNPAQPRVANGDFEQIAESDTREQRPVGWHYVRQAELVERPEVDPPGQAFQFKNEDAGRYAHALQGFAVDGRKVRHLRVQFDAKGDAIRFGQDPSQWPYVVITFYDDRRAAIADERIGPLRGTFDWTKFDEQVTVPIAAKEAIIRIGLLGARGTLTLDRLWVEAAASRSRR